MTPPPASASAPWIWCPLSRTRVLITIAISLGTLLPASLPTCARILLSYVANALMVACLSVVFQHLRDGKPEGETPSEGLLRAKALAAKSNEEG